MEDESDNCVICLERIVSGDRAVVSLACGHEFHAPCIVPWLQSDNNCPKCRHTLCARDQDLDDDSVLEAEVNRQWTVARKIDELAKLQAQRVKKSKDPKIKKKVNAILERIEEARKVKAKVILCRKTFLESSKFQKLKSSLQKAKNKFHQLKRRVHHEETMADKPFNTIARKLWTAMNALSRLGSTIDPQFYYRVNHEQFSDKMNSYQLQMLFQNGHINDDTQILHHAWSVEDVIYYKDMKHELLYRII